MNHPQRIEVSYEYLQLLELTAAMCHDVVAPVVKTVQVAQLLGQPLQEQQAAAVLCHVFLHEAAERFPDEGISKELVKELDNKTKDEVRDFILQFAQICNHEEIVYKVYAQLDPSHGDQN